MQGEITARRSVRFRPIADLRAMREVRSMPRVFSIPLKVLLVIFAVPLAALAALASWVFGLKAKLSASEVATYLRNFIEGGGGAWDWDDFTSVPIGDPR